MDTISATYKRCSKCKNEYPATSQYFHADNGKNDGFHAYCKSCCKKIGRERYADHPEKIKKWAREYYQRNQEAILASYRERYAENPEVFRARNHLHHVRHPGSNKQNALRYARRKQQLAKGFTEKDALRAFTYWRQTCAYCGQPLKPSTQIKSITSQFDHFISVSDLRPDNPGTVANNMLPCCASCNASKKNRDPIEWIVWKFGDYDAAEIINRIDAYFTLLRVQEEA